MLPAKSTSRVVHARGPPPQCSWQSIPTIFPDWNTGASSIEWMPFGSR